MLGLIGWAFLNIPVVANGIAQQAGAHSYWVMAYSCEDGYYPVKSSWGLNGYNLYTPYCIGGSQDFQFGFHALLITADRTMNWSYQTHRFEEVSRATQSAMPGMPRSSCPKEHSRLLLLRLCDILFWIIEQAEIGSLQNSRSVGEAKHVCLAATHYK